jgi:hypothetical protein
MTTREDTMSQNAFLRRSFTALEVNDVFTEAVVTLQDGSQLRFCHRVGERWARAGERDQDQSQPNLAEQVLAALAMFRLNGKHLDLQFRDGSHWTAPFRG